jgi:hypothetical protein
LRTLAEGLEPARQNNRRMFEGALVHIDFIGRVPDVRVM